MTFPTQRSAGRVGPAVAALVVLLSVAGGAVGGAVGDDTNRTASLDSVQASSHTGLTIEPSEIAFGTVAPGDRETMTVSVANTADESVPISGIEMTGDTEAFSIDIPQAIETAQQLDQTIEAPANSQRDVDIAFEPDSPGEYQATLRVLGPDGETLVDATATGTAAAGNIETSTDSLTFQGTTVGSTAARTLTVSNTGDAPLSVSSRVTGADSYSVQDGSTLDLQPGDSERVTVAFEPDSTDSQTALLELRSGDPDQPVYPVTLSNTDTRTAISTRQQGNDRNVNISVQEATAGEKVDVPVPSSANESESVAVDRISVTPSRDTNFSMNVTDSENPLSTTPDFETGDNATGIRYLNVSNSLPNEEIEDVQFTFRVRKDRVANLTDPSNENTTANPDAITMYRYNATTGWVEEGAKRIRTTDTHHVYVTNGTGFSEWTTAAKRPDIRVSDATASVDAARVGDTVDIQVTLQNDGGADGVFLTELLLNGDVVDDRRVTVPDDGTVGVTFERPFDQPGDYEVRVNEVSVGIIEVTSGGVQQQTATPGQSSNGGDTSSDGEDSGGDSSDDSGLSLPVMLGAGAVVLIGVVGGLLYTRGGEEAATETVAADTDDDVIQTEGFGEGGAVEGSPGDAGESSPTEPAGEDGDGGPESDGGSDQP